MFCHKCGTEIIAEDANYCFNCQEPLLKIPTSKSQNPSSGPGYLNDEKEDPTDNVNLEFGDGEDALRVSDPIDFLMNEDPGEPSPPEPPEPEKPAFNADTAADQPENEPSLPAVNHPGETDSYGYNNNNEPSFQQPNSADEAGSQQSYTEDKAPSQQPDTENEPSAPENTAENGFSVPPDVENNDAPPQGYNIENQPIEPDNMAGGGTPLSSENIEDQPVSQENNIENQPESPAGSNMSEAPESVDNNTEEAVPEMNNIENQTSAPETTTDVQPPVPEIQKEKEPAPPQERTEVRQGTGTPGAAPNAAPSFSNSYNSAGGGGQQVATAVKQAPPKEMPPPINIKMDTNPNQGENIIATSKLKVEAKSKMAGQRSPGDPPTSRIKEVKPKADPSSLDLNKIRKSSRIAYLTGNTISFTGGPKLSAGDQIMVGQNSYEVRIRPRDKLNLYGMIGSIVVAIVLTLYFLGAFNGSPDGNLVGMVIGRGEQPMVDREVRLKESGDKVKTNGAGFFIFDNIPVGIYTVQYIRNGEVIGEDRITVLSGKTSTLKLRESDRIGMAAPMRRTNDNSQQIAVQTEVTPETQVSKKKIQDL